jgi:hypothetical protein
MNTYLTLLSVLLVGCGGVVDSSPEAEAADELKHRPLISFIDNAPVTVNSQGKTHVAVPALQAAMSELKMDFFQYSMGRTAAQTEYLMAGLGTKANVGDKTGQYVLPTFAGTKYKIMLDGSIETPTQLGDYVALAAAYPQTFLGINLDDFLANRNAATTKSAAFLDATYDALPDHRVLTGDNRFRVMATIYCQDDGNPHGNHLSQVEALETLLDDSKINALVSDIVIFDEARPYVDGPFGTWSKRDVSLMDDCVANLRAFQKRNSARTQRIFVGIYSGGERVAATTAGESLAKQELAEARGRDVNVELGMTVTGADGFTFFTMPIQKNPASTLVLANDNEDAVVMDDVLAYLEDNGI